MKEQGLKGEEAAELLASLIQFISVGLEIHLSDLLRRKYGDERPENPMIFILPDNTITGNMMGVMKYMVKLIAEADKFGGDLLGLLLTEIKKVDVEVSESGA